MCKECPRLGRSCEATLVPPPNLFATPTMMLLGSFSTALAPPASLRAPAASRSAIVMATPNAAPVCLTPLADKGGSGTRTLPRRVVDEHNARRREQGRELRERRLVGRRARSLHSLHWSGVEHLR